MIQKGELAIDPRGLIYEAYRIEGIGLQECRVILLDWAMSSPQGADMQAMMGELMRHYGVPNPDHPMTGLLVEGLARTAKPKRRRISR
jgi:hypothetical protein